MKKSYFFMFKWLEGVAKRVMNCRTSPCIPTLNTFAICKSPRILSPEKVWDHLFFLPGRMRGITFLVKP